MNNVKNESTITPMLFPYEPEHFWEQIRLIIREEIIRKEKEKPASTNLSNTWLKL